MPVQEGGGLRLNTTDDTSHTGTLIGGLGSFGFGGCNTYLIMETRIGPVSRGKDNGEEKDWLCNPVSWDHRPFGWDMVQLMVDATQSAQRRLSEHGLLDGQVSQPLGEDGKDIDLKTMKEEDVSKLMIELVADLSGQEVSAETPLFEMGMDSRAVIELHESVRKMTGIVMPQTLLFDNPTVTTLAKFILEQAHNMDTASIVDISSISTTQSRSRKRRATDFAVDPLYDLADLRANLRIDLSMTAPAKPPRDYTNVLLTGATGIVGRFQLASLLDRNVDGKRLTVHCIVRTKSRNEGLSRIRAACEEAMIWKDEWTARIVVLLGDLSKELFGLGQERFSTLCETMDAIYHTGASVSLYQGYTRGRVTNTLPLLPMIELCTTHRLKPLHFTSTLAIFPAFTANFTKEFAEEELVEGAAPSIQHMKRVFPPQQQGYPWTKYVCEELLREARDQGLPVTIYRLPNTNMAISTGFTGMSNVATALIASFIQEGFFPRAASWANNTPIDMAADVIVSLSLKDDRKHWMYHVCNPSVFTESLLREWAQRAGIILRPVSFEDFTAAIKARGPKSPIFNHVPVMRHWQKYWYEDPTSDRTEVPISTSNMTEDIDVSWPAAEQLWRASLVYLMRQELLPSDSKAIALDPQVLLDMARGQTGLSQLGGSVDEEDVLEAFRVFIQSALEESSNMSFLGRLLLSHSIRQRLCTLLYMTHRAHTHPAIRCQQIKQPLFVVGFDRASVMLVQQLLACDEGNRAPTFSEMLCPFGEDGEYVHDSPEKDSRLAPAQEAMDVMFGSSECVNRLGPLTADMAFDDSMILRPGTQFDAPEYESRLSGSSGSEAPQGYGFHKTFLQHLQWQQGGQPKRWLLASPDHVGHLDDVLTTYPDAKIVFAHRDVCETVAGRCQETLSLRHGLMTVDASKVAERELRQMATNAKAAGDFRRRHPHLKAQFADVTLSDLLKNPVGRVKRLYRKLKLSPLSHRSSQAMWKMVLTNRSKWRTMVKGMPVSVSHFGIDEDDSRVTWLSVESLMGKKRKRRRLVVRCVGSLHPSVVCCRSEPTQVDVLP
ncbi:unnamed protein product [Vitrella brassicaformis CCMP3155]|uniref:Carrier domain-containing protein n=1 Tax=Vitrella brassicaformis (strain CCMP3155) TaxID=1169540 RepID=A0A0G4ED51_VITBC|nr:unnamed protein product [Vitrella brassicaformis CCMP3155]|eukprot:CEL93275.1 unnamed protein product [Vitrella brassicaformis CCMP3155]